MGRRIGTLMVITDAGLAGSRGILSMATAALRGGADMVQYREKALSDFARKEQINDLLYLTRPRDLTLVVNDWFDLAVACGADGFQLGQKDMSVADARIIGGDCLVGCAVHSLAQAIKAAADGADYLMVGPVFPARDDNFPDAPGGLGLLREVAAAVNIPWFAAGGLTPANLPQAVAAGARRAAICTALMAAPDPNRVAAACLAQLRVAG